MTTDFLIALGLTVALMVVFWLLPRYPVEIKTPTTSTPSPLSETDRKREWISLLKLEYEKAADRYENLYRAIWQNFWYMAVVAGGILTFGAKQLGSSVLYLLALSPLVFWLVATFLPLNHYGEEIRERLRGIEDDINRVYFPDVSDPHLAHFKLFRRTRYKWRVQHAVGLFGVFLVFGWLLFLTRTVREGARSDHAQATLQLQAEPVRIELSDPHLPALQDSVAALSGEVRVLDSLVRSRGGGATPKGKPLGRD